MCLKCLNPLFPFKYDFVSSGFVLSSPSCLFYLQKMRALTPTNSPLSSPSKHGDRFIPSRAGANWSVNFHRINVRMQSKQHQTPHHPVQWLNVWPCVVNLLFITFIWFVSRKMRSHTIKIGRQRMAHQTTARVTLKFLNLVIVFEYRRKAWKLICLIIRKSARLFHT